MINDELTIRKNNNGLLLTLFVILNIFFMCAMGEFSIAKGTPLNQGKVFVMYAGSLVKIFEDVIGPAFQNETGYTYVGEGRGSVQGANMIRDGFRSPDVFVSAGAIPILNLMDNKPQLAEWLLEFGSSEMVIAYSPNSPYYDDLEKAKKGDMPWYDAISKEGFKFGRTDPKLDPKGYYAIITAKLANIYYNDSSIKERVLGEDGNSKQIFPEEILKTILESGQLDAVVAYKHEAISRGLPYITLPKEINLGDPLFSNFYKKANYTSESADQKTIYGEPIYFSITIPQTVKNMEGAISFVNFLLSENGSKIMENQGLGSIDVFPEGDANKLPPSVKDLAQSNIT
jgi:molybdate/tungstate transport system substrate-binding protein